MNDKEGNEVKGRTGKEMKGRKGKTRKRNVRNGSKGNNAK